MQYATIRFVTGAILFGWLTMIGSCTYSEYATQRTLAALFTSHAASSVEAACAYQVAVGIQTGGDSSTDKYLLKDICSQWIKEPHADRHP